MQLYSQALLDLSRDGSHCGVLLDATHEYTASNPICGDRIQLTVRVVEGAIQNIRHETRGCLLCRASASLLCQELETRTLDGVATEASFFRERITALQRGELAIGKRVDVFQGLDRAPSRVSCILLPWDALQTALSL